MCCAFAAFGSGMSSETIRALSRVFASNVCRVLILDVAMSEN